MLKKRIRYALSLLAVFGGMIVLSPLSLPIVHAQSTSGSSGTSDPTSGTAAVSGSDWTASEVSSKASEMPSFKGFDSLDKNAFIGRAASNSTFIGGGSNASPGALSSSSSSRRTSSGSRTSTSSSSRSRSTTSRTASRSNTANRNRTTTGTRTGTGTNSNNIASVTLLGSELKSSDSTQQQQVSTNRVRATKIENGINNYGKIKTVLPVTVEVDDQSNALVRGAVETQNDRRLVENYIKLYGIRSVKNELVCAENGQM